MRARRDLNGAVVVITGASSGIGRAAAHLAADKGARLVLAARSAADLAECADECERRGAQAAAVPTDVRDEEQVRALARAAIERFGRIDGWVNDAGVIAYGHFEETPADVFDDVIRTNLFGQIYGARAALAAFRRNEDGGALVNVASLWGRVTSPYVTPYVVSKFGVRAFSECLRQGLLDAGDADRIQVSTILPESIDTPIFGHGANYSGRPVRPVAPIADPERVAQAIVGCLERPRAEVTVGWTGHLLEAMHWLTPRAVWSRAMPRLFALTAFERGSAELDSGNVKEPHDENAVDGGWRNKPAVRMRRAAAVGLGAALPVVGAAVRARRR